MQSSIMSLQLQNTSVLLPTTFLWYSSLILLVLCHWLLSFHLCIDTYVCQFYHNDYRLDPHYMNLGRTPDPSCDQACCFERGQTKAYIFTLAWAHGLCWSALCSHRTSKWSSVKTSGQTSPHLLLPKLEEANRKAASRHTAPPEFFSLLQTSP